MYCSCDTTNADTPAKTVNLTGRLFFELRQVKALWYSGVTFNFIFRKQNDKVLITTSSNEKTFRLRICNFELNLVRNTILPELHNKISTRLEKGSPIRYQYTKMEFNTITLPPGTSYFESGPLFSSSVVPPLLLLFCQKQSRHSGNLSLSSQKFEMPGKN